MSSSLKVLYVGGTGTISHSAVKHSIELGQSVWVLNRGVTASKRPLPEGAKLITADIYDQADAAQALGNAEFDTVINVTSYTAPQLAQAIELFEGRTAQYIHISTASLYKKPIVRWPLDESTPRLNPFVAYSRAKIEAEDLLTEAYLSRGFPGVIVRPSHTYDDAQPPLPSNWTPLRRLLEGREVVVTGDGTSLWTVTHAEDFAVGLVGLCGNRASLGEAFHITSNFAYPWDHIYQMLGQAAGIEPRIVHIPTDLITMAAPDWGWAELLAGDLSHSALYDNTKIKRFVPQFNPIISFDEGARRLVAWQRANPEFSAADPEVDAIIDRLVTAYHSAEEIYRKAAPSA